MKRTDINAVMRDAAAFFEAQGFHLPPFAFWTPDDWRAKGPEVDEIVRTGLGWDITDYGMDDFARYGLILFTLRNGDPAGRRQSNGKPYCEKVMIAEVGQEHQMHCHHRKLEDIINRGGGRLAIQLYNSASDDTLAEDDVRVRVDGVERTFPAGTILQLNPGESFTVHPRLFHKFWAEGGRVLIGEVSTINDDRNDNFYHQMIGTGRFSEIVENDAPMFLLFSDYEKYWQGG